jgi:chromosome segregation ATPase
MSDAVERANEALANATERAREEARAVATLRSEHAELSKEAELAAAEAKELARASREEMSKKREIFEGELARRDTERSKIVARLKELVIRYKGATEKTAREENEVAVLSSRISEHANDQNSLRREIKTLQESNAAAVIALKLSRDELGLAKRDLALALEYMAREGRK